LSIFDWGGGPIANRRYGRLQVCVTWDGAGFALRIWDGGLGFGEVAGEGGKEDRGIDGIKAGAVAGVEVGTAMVGLVDDGDFTGGHELGNAIGLLDDFGRECGKGCVGEVAMIDRSLFSRVKPFSEPGPESSSESSNFEFLVLSFELMGRRATAVFAFNSSSWARRAHLFSWTAAWRSRTAVFF
jgi:hypothetical protein